MQSKATSVAAYLSSIPVERRSELSKVRRLIKKSLPKGYAETMQYGMISYVVPLKRYPKGYLGKKDVALPYVCLAAQKSYLALYLLNVYSDPKTVRWFKSAWAKSKKKLDMRALPSGRRPRARRDRRNRRENTGEGVHRTLRSGAGLEHLRCTLTRWLQGRAKTDYTWAPLHLGV
jgi:hypothetical protein